MFANSEGLLPLPVLCLFVAKLHVFTIYFAQLSGRAQQTDDSTNRTRAKPSRHVWIRGTPEGPWPPLLYRALGAVQLLRHAVDPDSIPHLHGCTGRPRVRRQKGFIHLRLVHNGCVPDGIARWLDC